MSDQTSNFEYQPQPQASGTGPLPKERNIVLVWLVWPLITFGIYGLVWYYKINRETKFNPQVKVEPVVALLAVAIGWLIIVPPFVSFYRTGERIAAAQRAAGLSPTCNGWIGLVLSFIFGLNVLYYQAEMNKVCQAYPGGHEGQQAPLRGV